jgi:hypothetical protein
MATLRRREAGRLQWRWILRETAVRQSDQSVTLDDREDIMPKFIIERTIPGAGALDRQQLAAITQTSCNVLKSMGPQIQWIESYVTDNKIYCVYIAPDEATIREHARLGQFPADSVQVVRTVIDPTFA